MKRTLQAVTLVFRLSLVGMVLTVASTVAISRIAARLT